MTASLAGMRVVVTREEPGELGVLLEERGATVVHVPLIRISAPADGGASLRAALADLDRVDWLVVTSPAGAECVGAAARSHPQVRLAAVGTATADQLAHLAGRSVDLVPTVQRGADLATELIDLLGDRRTRFLLAQAERPDPTLAERLRQAGHQVDPVAAYRTDRVVPDVARLVGADAVLFASGSAAKSWHASLGGESPPLPSISVAIGPTTAAVAERIGLKITAVSADHSVKGLVDELERVVTDGR